MVSIFRNAVEEASSRLSTYKNPCVSEATGMIDNMLKALGKGTICNDNVDDIIIDEDEVTVYTNYTCRGCFDTHEYTFPTKLLDVDNPVEEAKKIFNKEKLRDLQYAVTRAAQSLEDAEEALIKHKESIRDRQTN